MAIAFRSVGTRLKADVSATGTPQTVSMPAGHVVNDLLFLVVLADDRTGATTPSGWTFLGVSVSGTSGGTFTGVRTQVFYRIDTGSLGASVSVTFNTSAWPTGDPLVLAFIVAYSGCDTTGPIDTWGQSHTAQPASGVLDHPQLTTSTANDYLISIRSVGAVSARTFTNSVGTDVERLEDNDGFTEMSVGFYDSNAALAAGLQTVRTTTAATPLSSGSTMWSIAVKPASTTTVVSASAGEADGAGAAFNASVTATSGSWDACGSGMPVYSLLVDWAGSGQLDTAGTPLTANAYVLTDTSGWAASNSSIARVRDPGDTVWSLRVTPDGVSASGGANSSPHTAAGSVTAGNSYTAQCWVYSPLGWSDLRAAVDWYDASDAFISSGLGSATVVPAGTWTFLQQTLTAPALASRASVRFRFGATPPAGNVSYVYGLMLVDPATGQTFAYPRPGDDVTPDALSDGIISEYGRDQNRQLSPTIVGTMSTSVNDTTRKYSPEYSSSPLFGNLDPARDAAFGAVFSGIVLPLFRGKIDDFNVKADRGDRTVDFSFLDNLALLQGRDISTELFQAIRTGDAVHAVLDAVGWTGPRDIDTGATVMPYWWAEGTDAFAAVQDIVLSEGPPAVAYQTPDGTFVFRDRHHRIMRSESENSQASFAAKALGDCAAPAVTGLSFTEPFVYSHGWRDIVNSVQFSVSERSPDLALTPVWTSDDTISLSIGETQILDVSGSDPFMGAVPPELGTDYTLSGVGVITTSLFRTSGQSTSISVQAVGGSVVVTGMQLRARSVPVRRTRQVSASDSDSISQHGERSYPNQAPWANANDAAAIASVVVAQYAQRRPLVQLRVASKDPAHWYQVVTRTLSDRITIRNDELGLDSDFFIEHIAHTIPRMNAAGRPPVHSVVLSCEKVLDVAPANPFTFDLKGAGFDQGVFDPFSSDDPATIWIWGDPVQGTFDNGLFAT